jgi:outer membrane protein OmpA-like peptidoglycan-associated protein
MPSPELSDCLQPNRRAVVEIGGTVAKPAPKPKPGAKPGKPGRTPVEIVAMAQGNTAFDPGSAALKDGGKAEFDKAVAAVAKRQVTVGSIIIAGHTDRFEAENAPASLSEDRAKAAAAYLTSKGMDQKLMFWEGKGAKEPVPVTKFCE